MTKGALGENEDGMQHERPGWLAWVLASLAVGLAANVGTSFYWAGQIAANQRHTEQQLLDLKADFYRQMSDVQLELRRQREVAEDLRERLAAAGAPRR